MDESDLNDLLLSLKESPKAEVRWKQAMKKECENNEIKEWLIKNTEVVPTEFAGRIVKAIGPISERFTLNLIKSYESLIEEVRRKYLSRRPTKEEVHNQLTQMSIINYKMSIERLIKWQLDNPKYFTWNEMFEMFNPINRLNMFIRFAEEKNNLKYFDYMKVKCDSRDQLNWLLENTELVPTEFVTWFSLSEDHLKDPKIVAKLEQLRRLFLGIHKETKQEAHDSLLSELMKYQKQEGNKKKEKL